MPRDAPAYRQSQPYMSMVSKYLVLRSRGKCYLVGDNFLVVELGKECRAVLKISCRVSTYGLWAYVLAWGSAIG